MAKTITWYPPFAQPANPAAVAVAGGSLEADTTYYFRVFAVASAKHKGIITDEFSATTTSVNKQINLTWDAVPDATYYSVIVTTVSGEYDGSHHYIRGAVGGYTYTINTNAYTYTGTESTYYNLHPFYCDADFPDGLDKNNGIGYVTYSGGTTEDPITPQDIHDAIADTNYSVLDSRNWSLQGSLESTGGGSLETHFLCKQTNIWMAGRLIDDNSHVDTTIVFGRKSSQGSADYYDKPVQIQCVAESFNRAALKNGNYTFHGCKLIGTGIPATGQTNKYYKLSGTSTYALVVSDSAATFNETELADWYMNVNTSSFVFSGGKIPILYLSVATDFSNISNVDVWGLDCLAVADGAVINTINMTKYYSPYAHLRLNPAKAEGWKFYMIDCTVTYPDASYPGLPTIWWYGTDVYPLGHQLYWQYTFDLKVIDINGDPIEGATVVIKDLDGVEHADSPLTTDASGDIASTILTRCILRRNSTPGSYIKTWDYTQKTEKQPYTVTVTKAGYASKVIRYTMDKKREEVLLLSPESSTAIYDSEIYGSEIH